MLETVNASFKDLLSTGYFYDELKNYMKSTETSEIDLVSFSRDFAVPCLIKKSESYKEPSQTNRVRILNLAIRFLHNVDDEKLAHTIFALKKLAESEVDKNEKEIRTTVQPSRTQSCRQRSESAQYLGKMLTSIIKMFRLAQISGKKEESQDQPESVENSIKNYWELSMSPVV